MTLVELILFVFFIMFVYHRYGKKLSKKIEQWLKEL